MKMEKYKFKQKIIEILKDCCMEEYNENHHYKYISFQLAKISFSQLSKLCLLLGTVDCCLNKKTCYDSYDDTYSMIHVEFNNVNLNQTNETDFKGEF